MTALVALKVFGVPALSLGLALVYLVLALHADGIHRRCYLTISALYIGLAAIKFL